MTFRTSTNFKFNHEFNVSCPLCCNEHLIEHSFQSINHSYPALCFIFVILAENYVPAPQPNTIISFKCAIYLVSTLKVSFQDGPFIVKFADSAALLTRMLTHGPSFALTGPRPGLNITLFI